MHSCSHPLPHLRRSIWELRLSNDCVSWLSTSVDSTIRRNETISGLRWVRRGISEEESQLTEDSFLTSSFYNGFTGIYGVPPLCAVYPLNCWILNCTYYLARRVGLAFTVYPPLTEEIDAS
jgi:hypothetical protein